MKKVLIADNEPSVASSIEYIFNRTGKYHLVTAQSKEIAAQVIADNPDLSIVILDTDCLGQGGILDIVHGCAPQAKTILWSGLVVGDENPASFGVDRVVSKTTEPIRLLMAVAELLAA